jgi:DNA-binding transcriptional ArsR family regulator
MVQDAFAVVAEPNRRRILDQLRGSERTVNELVEALGISQPAMSKHLKVLRDSGFVSCRTVAQHRVYRLDTAPIAALDAWIEPYRQLWIKHFDALERHLDSLDDTPQKEDQ